MLKKTIIIVLLSHSVVAVASQITGRIAVWYDDSYSLQNVELSTSGASALANNKVWIEDLPSDVVADSAGCFCFGPTQDAFAYVNAFYYANAQIEFYNRLLAQLGISPMARLPVDLQKLEQLAPSGSAGGGSVSVTFADSLFDPSISAHEIGHEIQSYLMGMSVEEWHDRYSSDDVAIKMQQSGILEGAANFLAAAFLDNPKIGFASYFDVPSNLDAFVSYPITDMTIQHVIEMKLNSTQFAGAYPRTAIGLRDVLSDPAARDFLYQPDPYWASALINQPLWQAMIKFGKERIVLIYMQALHSFVDFRSYLDLANRLIQMATHDSEVQNFLRQEYRKRGLGVR